MKLHKKAMSAGFLVSVIIVILSFMLIAGTIARFFGDVEEKEAEQLCQNSVALRATATLSLGSGAVEARLSPLLCKTIEKEISGDREEVQKIIADKMAKCWEMFGAGMYKTSVFENTALFGHENNCFVCYVIPVEKITEDELEQRHISSLQFEDFLIKNNTKGTSYLNYIQSKAGGQGYVLSLLPEGIKEERAYSIVYNGKKQDCGLECPTTIIGGLTVAATGALIVATLPITGPITLAIAGGAAVATVVGAGTAVTGTESLRRSFFREGSNIDGIMLMDISEKTIANTVFNECNHVPDIAGK